MIVGAEVGGDYRIDLEKNETFYIPKARMIDYDYENDKLKFEVIEDNTDKFILGKYIALDYEDDTYIMGRKVKDKKIVRLVFYGTVSEDKINDLEKELGKYYFRDYSRALVNTNLLGLEPKFTENKFREYLNSLDLELSIIHNCFHDEDKSDSAHMLIVFNKSGFSYRDMVLKSIEGGLKRAKRNNTKYLYQLSEEEYNVLTPSHRFSRFNKTRNEVEVGNLASIPWEFISFKSVDVALGNQVFNQNKLPSLTLGIGELPEYKKDVYFTVEKDGIFMYTSSDSKNKKNKNVMKYKMDGTHLSFMLTDTIPAKDLKRNLRNREYKVGVKISNKLGLTRLKWLKEGKYAKG